LVLVLDGKGTNPNRSRPINARKWNKHGLNRGGGKFYGSEKNLMVSVVVWARGEGGEERLRR